MYAYFPVVYAYDTSRVESVSPESWSGDRQYFSACFCEAEGE